jgi:hypothetical protein
MFRRAPRAKAQSRSLMLARTQIGRAAASSTEKNYCGAAISAVHDSGRWSDRSRGNRQDGHRPLPALRRSRFVAKLRTVGKPLTRRTATEASG